MLDMNRRKRFFLNGLMLTAVAITVRAVAIAFNSYLTGAVGAEGIGLFTLIMNVYGFAITFATSGISLTVTRLVAEAVGIGREADCRKIMRNAVIYSLIFSIFASCIMFFFSDFFAERVIGDMRGAEPIRILALSLVPLSLCSVISGYFIGVKRVIKNAAVQVLGQAFRVAVTVFFIISSYGSSTARTVVGLTMAITLTELFCFLVGFIEYIIDRKRQNVSAVSGSVGFSSVTSMALPLALSAYIRSALLTLEHTLIPKGLIKRGENVSAALASYGVLHGMAVPMLLFPMSTLTSFSGLLVPEFAESSASGENERMKRLAQEALESTLIYASAVTVFLYIFSEELGYVLYNSYEAGHYIALMSCVIPIMYLDHVADSMLKGIGEHVYSMWINIADALISVLLVLILIPIMGIGGYAVVIVVMEAFNFIFSISRLHKRIPFRIDLIRSFLIPLLCAVVSAILSRSLFIMNGSEARAVWLLMKIVFAVCIFIAVYIPCKKIGNGYLKLRCRKIDQFLSE